MPAAETVDDEVPHRCCVGSWETRLRMAAFIPAVGGRGYLAEETAFLGPKTAFHDRTGSGSISIKDGDFIAYNHSI